MFQDSEAMTTFDQCRLLSPYASSAVLPPLENRPTLPPRTYAAHKSALTFAKLLPRRVAHITTSAFSRRKVIVRGVDYWNVARNFCDLKFAANVNTILLRLFFFFEMWGFNKSHLLQPRYRGTRALSRRRVEATDRLTSSWEQPSSWELISSQLSWELLS